MSDYELPTDHRYSKDDEWVVRTNEKQYRVGISDYAQQELGDVVFVELPKPGDTVKAGQPFGVIESVKAVSDLISPLTGAIAAINSSLEDNPEAVNEDCYGEGWLITLDSSDPSEFDSLMNAETYLTHIEERQD